MICRRLLATTIRTSSYAVALIVWQSAALGGAITVRDAQGLRSALSRAQPGATILLAPGHYGNGFQVERVNGRKDRPIVIAAADKQSPAVFEGGKQALHFVDCNFVTLRHVRVVGCALNGINADDGVSFETPSRGMVFENVTIKDIGPKGNHDALKLSGLRDFVVRNCVFSGWGGSAIDMVGCQNGIIENCQFIGKEGFSQSNGIQAKGGSEQILIRRNFFRYAGQRAVNFGGSTGLAYFRPKPQGYEAKDIEVVGNHFVSSMAPVAYVTSINCRVCWNTFVYPEKWVMRILQEQPIGQFQPCQQGVFESNLIVFDRRVQVFVNVGPNTRPETFSFRRNAWYSSDGNRLPSLPTAEINGVYQVDPMLENADTPDAKMRSKDQRLSEVGAHAFEM
ncbi:right-handed parallel beta-helix repeat-containing protein [bacterium]|nr:right-handed parallel beta-helix repeat-containing protein [bacterium]